MKPVFKNVTIQNEEFIKLGLTPAVTTAVSHNKKTIFLNAVGTNEPNSEKKCGTDNIFRLFSLSKIVATVGFLKLYDKGLVGLDDNVSKYIPEFANTKVCVPKSVYKTKKRENEIKIRHLLDMTSGVQYGGAYPASAIKMANIHLQWNSKSFLKKHKSCLELAKTISSYPTLFEPGEGWEYGLNFEVISGIIEVITGKYYVDYIDEEVVKPLKMHNSGFTVKDENKFTKMVYTITANKDGKVNNVLRNKVIKGKYHFLSDIVDDGRKVVQAGGSFLSTAEDYIKLLNMLLDGLDEDGNVFLKKETIELMTTTHSYFKKGFLNKFSGLDDEDYAYGFGVRIRRANNTYPITNVGEFGWDGVGGCFAIVDPVKKICAVNMLSGFPAKTNITDPKFIDNLYKDLSINNI